MISTGVHHLSFTVTDLERARRFYEDVMGFETIPRPDFGIGGVWYGVGNAQLHLIEIPEGRERLGSPPEKLSPLANHNAFAIGDYGEVLTYLRSKGVEVLETTPENGQMWIQDPDGNVLELISSDARPGRSSATTRS